ncbi:hypothetical protein GpartN1_g3678.t1 [Galdieria partita]|uniref:RWP-RK domain-containing protein n=1 Tax=Galdieria partita TaxID=83374 RepID=A0A9C7UQV8_9RHOD|nr:hypothetical protein GpartN1_g3678.t1 [Galdieria partita]
MRQGKHWSLVTYQIDSILPRTVYDDELLECTSGSLDIDKRAAHSRRYYPRGIPFYFGPPSEEANTAYRDSLTCYNDNRLCYPKCQQIGASNHPEKNLPSVTYIDKDEQICENCQMHICSCCGNPFSDEEYSNCHKVTTVLQENVNTSDQELREWRQWQFHSNSGQVNRLRDTSLPIGSTEHHHHVQQLRNKSSLSGKSSHSSLTIDHLSRYFDLPRKEAARQLGLCVTLLKRRCRELGIHSWPFRKMRCLDDRIRHLQLRKEGKQSTSDDCIDRQIWTLEQRRQSLLRNPNVPLRQLLGDQDDS